MHYEVNSTVATWLHMSRLIGMVGNVVPRARSHVPRPRVCLRGILFFRKVECTPWFRMPCSKYQNICNRHGTTSISLSCRRETNRIACQLRTHGPSTYVWVIMTHLNAIKSDTVFQTFDVVRSELGLNAFRVRPVEERAKWMLSHLVCDLRRSSEAPVPISAWRNVWRKISKSGSRAPGCIGHETIVRTCGCRLSDGSLLDECPVLGVPYDDDVSAQRVHGNRHRRFTKTVTCASYMKLNRKNRRP